VAVLERMLAKDPEGRYAVPAEAARALAPWCGGADLPALLRRATPDGERPAGDTRRRLPPAPAAQIAPSPRWLRTWPRRKWIVALLGLLLTGGLGFAVGMFVIHIKQGGRETVVQMPAGSDVRIEANGQVHIQLPGPAKAAKISLADQLRKAKAGDYWAQYNVWAAYQKGTSGAGANPEVARTWLAELVKGAYLVTFRSIKGFAPRTPGELCDKFTEYAAHRSDSMSLGMTSFYRTQLKDGRLLGSFVTEYPEKVRQAIAVNPFLELVSMDKLTQEMFICYEASVSQWPEPREKPLPAGHRGRTRRSAAETPNDKFLDESQRLFRDRAEEDFAQFFNPPRGAEPGSAQRGALENQSLAKLSAPCGASTTTAINTLAALGSVKAVAPLLKIATAHADNLSQDRWMAVRALGLIGDRSVVPALIDLLYHYDQNTRFWAQISLVRLSGQNFGRDVAAWKGWWRQQQGKPPAADEPVVWTTRLELLKWADPQKQAVDDRQLIQILKSHAPATNPR